MQGFRLGYRPGLGQGGFLPRNVGESHGFHDDLRWFKGSYHEEMVILWQMNGDMSI